MTDLIKLTRDAFNKPNSIGRTKERIIYDFFNYDLMKNDIDPKQEGYNEIKRVFELHFKEQSQDVFDLVDKTQDVFGEDAGEQMYDYLNSRRESMFMKWCQVNSLFEKERTY